MTIESLRGTRAWSNEHDLPTFPETNNGWLYLAYAVRLFQPSRTWLRPRVYALLEKTKYGFKRIDSEIPLSHDEVLGLAFLGWYLGEIFTVLVLIDRKGGTVGTYDELSENFYRLPEMAALVKAGLLETPSPYEQLLYGLQLVLVPFKEQGQWSSPLRSWVSIPLMRKFLISAAFILAFELLMRAKRKTLSTALREYFPTVPELGSAADGKAWSSDVVS